MPVFGSFSVQIGPEVISEKVEQRPVSIDDSSCVHLGVKLIYHLEGRCSIQLSYGRNQLIYSTLLRQFALHTMLLAMLKSWCEAQGMSRERSASCWRTPAEAGKRRRMSLSQHIIESLHCHNLCGQATIKEVTAGQTVGERIWRIWGRGVFGDSSADRLALNSRSGGFGGWQRDGRF